MFIVKRRADLIRFGLFLLLAGLMAYFISGKAALWQATMGRRTAEHETAPEAAPYMPKVAPRAAEAEAPGDGRDYFAAARMDRQRERSVREEQLLALINNPNVDVANKARATEELQVVQRLAILEDKAERNVRDLGFQDVVVNLTESAAIVAVKAKTHSQQMALQVQDRVSRITGIKVTAVSVSFRP